MGVNSTDGTYDAQRDFTQQRNGQYLQQPDYDYGSAPQPLYSLASQGGAHAPNQGHGTPQDLPREALKKLKKHSVWVVVNAAIALIAFIIVTCLSGIYLCIDDYLDWDCYVHYFICITYGMHRSFQNQAKNHGMHRTS